LRLAARQRTAVARDHLCLRQPAGRGPARCAAPRRALHRAQRCCDGRHHRWRRTDRVQAARGEARAGGRRTTAAAGGVASMTTPALLTDHYELTMVDAAMRSGTADRRCVFEVFARSLPGRRRYGVAAGVGRLLELLPYLRFDADALDFLGSQGVVDAATCDWLAGYRFTGSIDGYAEGETYFPHSPV